MTEKSSNERFADIEENLKIIRENIANAAQKSGRSPNDIKFMAVTKTVEPIFINHAIDCGIDLIGENRVQEYLEKKDDLNLKNCDVHLIGHLQTNKIKQIIKEVTMIQSVDSINLAQEISKYAQNYDLNMDILLEVNIGNEDSKFGLDRSKITETCHEISEFKGITVKGLMTIPPICENEAEQSRYFSNMFNLFIDIQSKKMDNISMDILSMGMSDDYQQAILEGSNLVRIGSAIFGARKYN